jgi:two-component system response regulator NreC
MTKIVLLDEQQLFLEAFQYALQHQEPSISVVGAVKNARQAFELVSNEGADLLVSDLLLQGTDAASVARELLRRRSSAGLLVLTMETNRAFVEEATEAGIRGYALKTQPLAEVVEAITQAARGVQYFAPSLGFRAERIQRTPVSTEDRPALLSRLSRREREVFFQILHCGSSSRKIAQSLSISLKTVETHRSHINRKLDVHSTAELLRVAAATGLLGAREHTPHESGAFPAGAASVSV